MLLDCFAYIYLPLIIHLRGQDRGFNSQPKGTEFNPQCLSLIGNQTLLILPNSPPETLIPYPQLNDLYLSVASWNKSIITEWKLRQGVWYQRHYVVVPSD